MAAPEIGAPAPATFRDDGPAAPGWREAADAAVARALRGDAVGAADELTAALALASLADGSASGPALPAWSGALLAARQAEVSMEADRAADAFVASRRSLRAEHEAPAEVRATAQALLAESLMDAGLTDSALAEATRAARLCDAAPAGAEVLRARRRTALVHAEALAHEGRSHAALMLLDRSPQPDAGDSPRLRARWAAVRAAALTSAGRGAEAAALLVESPSDVFDHPLCRGQLVLALEARRIAAPRPASRVVDAASERVVLDAARAFLRHPAPSGDRAVILAALRIANLPVLRMHRDLLDALRDVARANAAARTIEIDAACRAAREISILPPHDLAVLAAWRTRVESLPQDPDDPFRRV